MLLSSRLTLFGRLYIFIFLAIVAAVWVTRIIIDIYYEDDEFMYFVGTSNYLRDTLSATDHPPPVLGDKPYQQIEVPKIFLDEFVAMWVSEQITVEDICSGCRFIESIGGGDYYTILGDGLVVFPTDIDGLRLVITDVDRFTIHGHVLKDDVGNDFIIYWLISILSVFIGITVYWPLRRLDQQINFLIASHHRFGEGYLQEQAQAKFDKPLDELAVSFNHMARSIETHVKESYVLTQAIPHELRTPLSRIQMALGLLKKAESVDEQEELLANIDAYIEDINNLVSQIVSLSKLKSSLISEDWIVTDENKEINLRGYVLERLGLINGDQGKNVEVDIDPGIQVEINPVIIRLVLDNLMTNAVKYSRQEILVRAVVDQGCLSVVVEDDGEGIAEDQWDYIFIPFARLDSSRSRKTGGLGLGLSIAKAAANCFGGDIFVGDSGKGGACFEWRFFVS